uniref:Uncharacterized protein n=1 Tax=Oryza glumipatula TaxID=40148 RepID=A0A0D9ZBK1_9ORYZ
MGGSEKDDGVPRFASLLAVECGKKDPSTRATPEVFAATRRSNLSNDNKTIVYSTYEREAFGIACKMMRLSLVLPKNVMRHAIASWKILDETNNVHRYISNILEIISKFVPLNSLV